MNHRIILDDAATILNDRDEQYGSHIECFGRISKIASGMLDFDVSEYHIAIILLAVKLGRMAERPCYIDNYVDGINYLAFAGEFANRTAGGD